MQGKDMYNDDTGKYDQYVLLNNKVVSYFSTCKSHVLLTTLGITKVNRDKQHLDMP